MQVPNDAKLASIRDAATKLFATLPFHEVRLDDIAREAGVGKGTLYVYFDSKETLYLSLVRDGFALIETRVREKLASARGGVKAHLKIIAAELISFAATFPDVYRVMRTKILTPEDPGIQAARRDLSVLIESTIRDGIARGELADPHPEITTQFILSFVRGVMLYPPPDMTPEQLRDHLVHVIWSGIGGKR